ncbi:lysophospholipid acyltransferase family protein [Nocardioides jensenii]|uniref:lysophospholipid acyltransferase family protein n=1 Tax=Nocardioides jensenii TaxID=1843 RepID=UPI0008337EE1|nr:lysophospholipid acyltransferase family protein [Nocardioides jensenii]
MTVRDLDQPRGWAFSLAVPILKPTLLAASRRVWIDGDKIPATGGCVIALNHVSHIDPLMAAHFVYDHGRLPRYLAKAGLFSNKLLGGFLDSAGQIPVQRQSANALGAFSAAVEAVRQGECVVVYPEGTITRDPDLWPMTGKSGAARIALETGAPVIPVAHWGVQEILAPYAKSVRLLPRKTVTFKAGDPVALDDLAVPQPDQRADTAAVTEATGRIMAAITGLLEDLRGEKAPPIRFDPRQAGVTLIGNPHKKQKKGKDKR